MAEEGRIRETPATESLVCGGVSQEPRRKVSGALLPGEDATPLTGLCLERVRQDLFARTDGGSSQTPRRGRSGLISGEDQETQGRCALRPFLLHCNPLKHLLQFRQFRLQSSNVTPYKLHLFANLLAQRQ